MCVLQLLQYHVVPGMAMTVDTLTNGQTLTTALSGQTLKVIVPAAAVMNLKMPSVFVPSSGGEQGGEGRGEMQW